MIDQLSAASLWLVAALGAISVGSAAGPVAWRLAGESGQAIGPVSLIQESKGARTDLSPILVFAPFGSAVALQDSEQVVGETDLGLVLLGVTVSEASTKSRAIIGGGDSGRADSYAVGATITAAATLAEVTRTHVVLSVDGRLETLSFSKPEMVSEPEMDKPSIGNTDLRNLIPPSSPSPSRPIATDPDAVIAQYRERILQNPEGVIDRLGLEATSEGYLISEVASPEMLKAGFRPADLVTMVNGKKVGDISRDQGYFDEVVASGKARVELQRDGQSIVMTFPLR